ncbi:MAG: hypothetical protein MUD16_02150 [Desulfobacterales bacterium]|jgi:transposase-like protein|nr:hypothetical protein [Desulfobacterales bacterium]
MKARGSEIFADQKGRSLEDIDQELDEEAGAAQFSKSKVECVCPGCGRVHVMKMKWIGRGVPRKFCQNCRDRETPLENEE